METIKIIGRQETYTAWCHELEKELNDVTDAECEDKFIWGCATCLKLECLHLLHEVPIVITHA